MPIHDWTRVDAGTFHDLHSAWIIHLKEALNGGVLPRSYYAMAEQHAGQVIADVLTLQVGDGDPLQYIPSDRNSERGIELSGEVVATLERQPTRETHPIRGAEDRSGVGIDQKILD